MPLHPRLHPAWGHTMGIRIIRSLRAMTNRSPLRSSVSAIVIILLAGCASVPGEVIRNLGGDALSKLSQPQIIEDFHAKVLSPRPPYAARYDISIHGSRRKTHTQPHLVMEGRYQSWSWVVKAEPQVAVALQHWLQTVQSSQASGNDGISPALGWNAMMRRLYVLDTYLLGSPPMPLQIHILLLPAKEYHYQATLRSDQALPVRLVLIDKDPQTTSPQAELVQAAVVFVTQHTFQGLLADAEWKSGAMPKPPKGSSRTLKFYANQFCWGYAADAATVAGLSPLPVQIKELFPHAPTNGFAIMMAKATYHLRPADPALRQSMAYLQADLGLQGYLKKLGMSPRYPNGGTALLTHLNGMINYCRDFTHYTGNIENQPIPPRGIQGGSFFPLKKPPVASVANPPP